MLQLRTYIQIKGDMEKDIMITEDDFLRFVAEARRVGDMGLTSCSSGNLSWRRGELALVTGTGSWVPALTQDKVAVCRISDGESLNGVRPSMEIGFHLGIMRQRPDVEVVLHFQSPYATVVSCMKDKPSDFNVTAEVPCHVGSGIPVVPYFRPGSPELAAAVVEAMKEHNSVLLSSHGQVVCGKDFNQAIERAVFFEMACRIIVLSGGRYETLGKSDIDDLQTYILGKK